MTIRDERDNVMPKTAEDACGWFLASFVPGACEGVEPVLSARIPYV